MITIIIIVVITTIIVIIMMISIIIVFIILLPPDNDRAGIGDGKAHQHPGGDEVCQDRKRCHPCRDHHRCPGDQGRLSEYPLLVHHRQRLGQQPVATEDGDQPRLYLGGTRAGWVGGWVGGCVGVTIVSYVAVVRKTKEPRMPTIPERSTSGFHRLGGHCAHQARSAVRYSASRMKGELHPTVRESTRSIVDAEDVSVAVRPSVARLASSS